MNTLYILKRMLFGAARKDTRVEENYKILSYSLFEPQKKYDGRFWDIHDGGNRYWYNLPAMVVLNRLLYPDFKIYIYISSNIKNNPLYALLVLLQDKGHISLVEIELDYSNTEPTLFRYKPLLNQECDVLLCRDIDSLPTVDEVRATKYFIESEFRATTIRSHTNHTCEGAVVLAGLCGFRPKTIDLEYKSFDCLMNDATGEWGFDQNFLIRSLTKDKRWTSKHFLDSRISSEEHKVGKPLIKCTSFNENYYRKQINLDIDREILIFLSEMTKWAGEPIDCRKDKLSSLLSMRKDFGYMTNLLEANTMIKDFYLGS